MIWPVDGPPAGSLHRAAFEIMLLPVGAGDGNRTRMTSLEGCAYQIAAQAIPRSACMAIARE